METLWKPLALLKIGLVVLAVSLSACSKSKTSSTSTDTDDSDGYITCPTSGTYIRNGTTYSCTSGATVYVGTSYTGQYITCSSTGYYTYSGTTYSCTAGETIYVDGDNDTTGCSTYNDTYGVNYVRVRYQGSYVCMREDLAEEYGYTSVN